MENEITTELLKMLGAGSDLTTIVIGYILFKYNNRLITIESKLDQHITDSEVTHHE